MVCLTAGLASLGSFTPDEMMKILRNEDSGISRPLDGRCFATTASMVSCLSVNPTIENVSWFTATPDPQLSAFKPFRFANLQLYPNLCLSPADTQGDRRHCLFKAQENFRKKVVMLPCDQRTEIISRLRQFEQVAVKDSTDFYQTCENEIDFYGKN
jgi:hypothetical protein